MSWLDGLCHRLKARLAPERNARERAEESRIHREMEAARSGAVRVALALGKVGVSAAYLPHPDQERAAMRPRFIDWIRQDFAYAVRGIVRNPGFTAMVVVTLALGVGANAAVFSLLDRVFTQTPAGIDRPDQLRRLYIWLPERETPEGRGLAFASYNWPAFEAVRSALPDAGVIAWTPPTESAVRVGEAQLTVLRSFVTHDYFAVLGVTAARGRFFGPDEQRVDVPARVVILSHGLWKNALGSDPGIMGRTLEYDGESYTVIGVAADGFSGLELTRTDVFFPVSAFEGSGSRPGIPFYQNDGNFFRALLRVEDPATEATLAQRAAPSYRASRSMLRQGRPDSDSASYPILGHLIVARGPGARDQMLSVSTRPAGVSLIVLAVACANIASLLLVRASRRRRELVVRLALGVTRARLLAHTMMESVVLAALAGVAAVFAAVWGGAVLRRLLMPTIQWAQPLVEGRVVGFTLATALLVGLLAGMAPALQSRRIDVNAGLKADSRQGGVQRSWMRSGLLAAQAALSVVLLVGAGLFLRSLGKVNALDLGYDVHALSAVRLPLGSSVPDQYEILSRAATRLRDVPGVSGVALATSAPMLGSSGQMVVLPDRDSVPELPSGFNSVSPDFFAVTGTQILQGRTFHADEIGSAVIVSESLARRYWPGESALGKCLILGGAEAACSEVVGVVEDVRFREIIEDPTLQYFVPLDPASDSRAPRSIVLRVDASAWPAAAELARAELASHLDLADVRFTRVSEALDPQIRPWRLGAQLFTAFGLLALVVTVVGFYSVTAYAVSQRTYEMGVRIALGARVRTIIALVLGEGAALILVGIALGIAVALALGRLVATLLYGVTPRDPAVMAGAGLVLLAVGLVASLVPAWRAARIDPVRALAVE